MFASGGPGSGETVSPGAAAAGASLLPDARSLELAVRPELQPSALRAAQGTHTASMDSRGGTVQKMCGLVYFRCGMKQAKSVHYLHMYLLTH